MQYPLTFSFKIVALAPQIYVTDANNAPICYVKQKMFKLKEAVNVFTDNTQQQLLCQINADRVIDFSANYHFTDANGNRFGAVRRKGMKSIFKAHYEILENDQVILTVQEDNAWVKVMDALLGEIPILGMFTGYFFNPSYTMKTNDGVEVMRAKKQPSFFESKFLIEKFTEMDEVAELRSIMSYLMMALLERGRG